MCITLYGVLLFLLNEILFYMEFEHHAELGELVRLIL